MTTRWSQLVKGLGGSCTALAVGGALMTSTAPVAQSAGVVLQSPIIRVEEDWKLVLNEPDDGAKSPQFHTTMSPFADNDSYFGMVTWNYRETPEFQAGGLQLSAWEGESLIRSRSIRTEPLSTEAETVTWTQAIFTDGLTLSFEVFNGSSSTWGQFDRDMRIDSAAYLPNLHQYSPTTTVENSCATFGTNRVDTLEITQVRYYDAEGVLVMVDDTPRTVCGFEDRD